MTIFTRVFTVAGIATKTILAVLTLVAAWHGAYAHALGYGLGYWFLVDFVLPTVTTILRYYAMKDLAKTLAQPRPSGLEPFKTKEPMVN